MKKKIQNEFGISLIEVIASILILTIILISFFSLLIQSNRTNSLSESIADATYIAQMEMENLYTISEDKNNIDDFVEAIKSNGYTLESTNDFQCTNPDEIKYSNVYVFVKTDSQYPDFKKKITIKKIRYYYNSASIKIEVNNSASIKIEVIDVNANSIRAIMENVIKFKGYNEAVNEICLNIINKA